MKEVKFEKLSIEGKEQRKVRLKTSLRSNWKLTELDKSNRTKNEKN